MDSQEKQQVVHIHGGTPAIDYEHYLEMIRSWKFTPEKKERWSRRHLEFLGDDYQVIRPEMPNAAYAHYIEWDIWWRKVIPFIKDGAILIGHSLGGGFLMKWLSENTLDVSIAQLHLVAPTYHHVADDYQLGDFMNHSFPGVFKEQKIGEIHFYHSLDDKEVPLSESEDYHAQLEGSQLHKFEKRGHFLDETFPELFENITSY